MEAYNVRGLLNDPEQVITVEELLPVSEFTLSGEKIPLTEPVSVSGTVSAVGGGVLRFDGTAGTRAIMSCARCNKPVEVPFCAEISQRFAKEADPSRKSYSGELSLEELDAEPISENDRIDLEDIILYEVKLSIPMKVLCREDCKGLCPVCGKDLNEGTCSCDTRETDPRWDALKGLSFGDEE